MLLAYAAPDMSELVKDAMGWNFAPAELGTQDPREIVELVLGRPGEARRRQGRDLRRAPAAMEAMANRETTGRTIVRV